MERAHTRRAVVHVKCVCCRRWFDRKRAGQTLCSAKCRKRLQRANLTVGHQRRCTRCLVLKDVAAFDVQGTRYATCHECRALANGLRHPKIHHDRILRRLYEPTHDVAVCARCHEGIHFVTNGDGGVRELCRCGSHPLGTGLFSVPLDNRFAPQQIDAQLNA